jgi:glycosyltransferase involved in cell wall biosynthesis
VVAISEPEFLSNHSPYDAWYPLDGAATGAAFELQFSPWILGGVPAAVQLVAVVGNRQVVLSQEYSGQQIIRNIAFGLGETKPRSLISRWIGGLSLVGQARVPVEEGFVRPRTNGILVVAHNVSPFEGAPRVLLKLLKEYKQNHPGVSVSVLSLRADSPSADVLAVADNFYSAPQPLVPPYDETRFAEIVGLVDDTLCRVKPDLVITNVIDSFPAVFAAKRRGLEVHWMIHESKKPETSFLDSLPEIQQVYLNALTTADRLIFVSASTAALYLGVRGDRPISIAANGLDLSEIDKFKSEWSVVKAKAALGVGDELVVSIIGTVDSRKGQDIFVREMALLRDHLGTMRLRCFIVGCRGGDFLERLRREILKLRLDDVISLVDESPHVGLYLQATDVVCICSREESAPLVVLEAMGFAKPIVSTAVFGLSEQLRDRSDALIFDHKIVGDLAEKIICLINEPGLRDQISVEARRSVESRFTIKAQYEVFAQGIKVT